MNWWRFSLVLEIMYSLVWPVQGQSSSPNDQLGRKRRTVVSSLTEDEELTEVLKSYSSNKVNTTKYSFLSFVPKNLFEQLHRFVNVYFFFLAALNFIPVVNAFHPALFPFSWCCQ